MNGGDVIYRGACPVTKINRTCKLDVSAGSGKLYAVDLDAQISTGSSRLSQGRGDGLALGAKGDFWVLARHEICAGKNRETGVVCRKGRALGKRQRHSAYLLAFCALPFPGNARLCCT